MSDKTSQLAVQAMYTPEQAIEWAEREYVRTGKWPNRRYRIEGGTLRSGFLPKSKALRDAIKFGGWVNELIPDMIGYISECDATGRRCVIPERLRRRTRRVRKPGR